MRHPACILLLLLLVVATHAVDLHIAVVLDRSATYATDVINGVKLGAKGVAAPADGSVVVVDVVDSRGDAYYGAQALCNLAAQTPLMGVVGGYENDQGALLRGLTTAASLPFVNTQAPQDLSIGQAPSDYAFSTLSAPDLEAQELLATVQYYGWTRFVLLVNNDALSLAAAVQGRAAGLGYTTATQSFNDVIDVASPLSAVVNGSFPIVLLLCTSCPNMERLMRSETYYYSFFTGSPFMVVASRGAAQTALGLTSVAFTGWIYLQTTPVSTFSGLYYNTYSAYPTDVYTAAAAYDAGATLASAIASVRAQRATEVGLQSGLLCAGKASWSNGYLMAAALRSANLASALGPIHYGVDGNAIRGDWLYQFQGSGIFRPLLSFSFSSTTSSPSDIVTNLQMAPYYGMPVDTFSLAGRNVRCIFKLGTPFVVKPTDSNAMPSLQGIDPLIMQQIATTLGLNVEYIQAGDDVTSDDLVNLVSSGQYDMGMGYLSITTDRQPLVDFTQPYLEVANQIAMRRPSPSSHFFLFLKPFTWGLWLVIVAFIIVSAALYYYNERARADRVPPTFFRGYFSALWNVSAAFTDSIEKAPKTPGARFYALAMWAVFVVIIASYTANLTAYLSSATSGYGGIGEVYAALSTGALTLSQIGVVAGGVAERYVRVNFGTTYKAYVNRPALMDALANYEIDLAIDTDTLLTYTIGRNCSFQLTGTTFNVKGYGIAFPKNSKLTEPINGALLTLKENGVVNQIYTDAYANATCSPINPSQSEDSVQLRAEDMGGLFISFLIICFFAVIVNVTWDRKILHEAEQAGLSVHDHHVPSAAPRDDASSARGGGGGGGVMVALNRMLDGTAQPEAWQTGQSLAPSGDHSHPWMMSSDPRLHVLAIEVTPDAMNVPEALEEIRRVAEMVAQAAGSKMVAMMGYIYGAHYLTFDVINAFSVNNIMRVRATPETTTLSTVLWNATALYERLRTSRRCPGLTVIHVSRRKVLDYAVEIQSLGLALTTASADAVNMQFLACDVKSMVKGRRRDAKTRGTRLGRLESVLLSNYNVTHIDVDRLIKDHSYSIGKKPSSSGSGSGSGDGTSSNDSYSRA